MEDIIAFIREYNGISDDVQIDGDTQITAQLGLSSFDIVEMCCQMEEQFEIEINDEDLSGIVTIGDFAELISGKKHSME